MNEKGLCVHDHQPGSRRALAALQLGLFAAFIDQCFAGPEREPSQVEKLAYPHFRARALVLQQDSPRHAAFEPWINVNPQVAFLDALMAGRDPLPHPSRIVLFLPERWLNPVEQQRLMQALHEYAGRTKALQQVDVITQCPVILTDFAAPQVRVLTTPFPL